MCFEVDSKMCISINGLLIELLAELTRTGQSYIITSTILAWSR